MTTAADDPMIARAAAFAAKHIIVRHDLQTVTEFPMDLWQEMAERGLFKIGIAETHGGSGGGYRTLSTAGYVFVQAGLNLGLAVSWLYQQLIARYLVAGFGTGEQQRQYLPMMAQGKIIVCFAVSEPTRGAHPKFLTTTAVQDSGQYILNGKKTYLTNGPIAGLFIVMAVTDEVSSQKRFTAFLVPRDTPGVYPGSPLAFNFLKPSPHGGIVLKNCRISKTSILGKEDTAYRDMVIPFGEIEDIVMMGTVAGAMAAQLDMLLLAINSQYVDIDGSVQKELGAIDVLLQALRTTADEAARILDQDKPSPVSLMISFAKWTEEFLTRIAGIVTSCKINTSASYKDLQSDLMAVAALKQRRLQARREKLDATTLKESRV